jgi:hypothetical protein
MMVEKIRGEKKEIQSIHGEEHEKNEKGNRREIEGKIRAFERKEGKKFENKSEEKREP